MGLTSWYNHLHTPKSFWRSRASKDLLKKLLSPEGYTSQHSRNGTMLPMLIEWCNEAGRAYTIRAAAIDGRIVGYLFDTTPERTNGEYAVEQYNAGLKTKHPDDCECGECWQLMESH